MFELPQPWTGYRQVPKRMNLAEEVLWRAVQPHMAEELAFVTEAGPVTYQKLVNDIYSLSEGFAERCGMGPGSRVLVKLWNSYEYVVVFLALVKIGAIPILVNSRTGESDTSFIGEQSKAEFMVTFGDLACDQDRRRYGAHLILGRGVGQEPGVDLKALLETPVRDKPFFRTGSDEPAFMVYTSGTTGRPKGIVHAHRWIVALGDSNKLRLPPEPEDVVLASGEWSFISALGHNVLFPLRNGVVGGILDGHSRPESVVRFIEEFRVTVLYTVPTLYRKLLSSAEFLEGHDLSSLRACNANGEGLEAATLEAWRQATGKVIYEHYGISEMQMIIGQSPRIPLKPGSVGVPWGCCVRFVDDQDGEVPVGSVGELQVDANNPGLFLGYLDDPEKTSAVLRDGWCRTGDYAWQDEDGYIWLAGRKDHCFKSRGYFVAPIEIENCCREVIGVSEACVIPMPDPIVGQRIHAVLVAGKDQNTDVLLSRLYAHLMDKLPRYKMPEEFEWREELPKTALGKVNRKALVAELSSGAMT